MSTADAQYHARAEPQLPGAWLRVPLEDAWKYPGGTINDAVFFAPRSSQHGSLHLSLWGSSYCVSYYVPLSLFILSIPCRSIRSLSQSTYRIFESLTDSVQKKVKRGLKKL